MSNTVLPHPCGYATCLTASGNRDGGTRTHDHRFIRTALLPTELHPCGLS